MADQGDPRRSRSYIWRAGAGGTRNGRGKGGTAVEEKVSRCSIGVVAVIELCAANSIRRQDTCPLFEYMKAKNPTPNFLLSILVGKISSQ